MKKIFSIIWLSIAVIWGSSCDFSEKTDAQTTNKQAEKPDKLTNYGKAKIIGTIQDDAIKESSGVVASRYDKENFWTHNDSGDDSFLFAFDRKGKKLGVWKLQGVKNYDWEDIAAYKDKNGTNFLVIGDIGDNNKKRETITIHRVAEPKITGKETSSSKKKPIQVSNVESFKISYEDKKNDAEALMINPNNGDIYILSKNFLGASDVYKVSWNLDKNKVNTAKKIASISVPALPGGLLTGGDISPDGKRVIICDYFGAYEFMLPDKAKDFDDVWKQEPKKIELGERKQGEAICYRLDGKAIIATSEKEKSPIIEVERK